MCVPDPQTPSFPPFWNGKHAETRINAPWDSMRGVQPSFRVERKQNKPKYSINFSLKFIKHSGSVVGWTEKRGNV